MKSILLWVFLGAALFACAGKADASDPPVIVFNEIAWRGSSSSTADEFIELKNMGAQPVVLDGWAVYDEVKSKEMLKIPSATIAPEGYFLIANNEKGHEFSAGISFLDIEPGLVDSSVSLSNSNFKISIRDDTSQIIDIAGDGGTPFFGEYNGKISSMQRIDYSGYGESEAAWEPTKERKNIISSIKDYATPENTLFENPIPVVHPVGQCFIKFTELTVKPKEDYDSDGKINYTDEWIEIANTSTEAVNLSGIKISDKSLKTYALPSIDLAPLGYLVIYRNESRISLNDTGEILSMTDIDGAQIDYVEVPSVPTKVMSYAMWADKWYFTTEATIGVENKIYQKKQIKNPSNEMIRDSEGLSVKINATVASLERDRATITYNNEFIDLMSEYDNLFVGEQVVISGHSHSGSNSIIDASSVDQIKTKIKSVSVAKTKISTKTKAKIKKSISISPKINLDSYNFEKVKPFLSSNGFNLGKVLLYSYSIFLFAFIVLSNEIFSSLKL